MSMFEDRSGEPLDEETVERDHQLLDALADDAVSWDLVEETADPAFRVLAALRADLDTDLPKELLAASAPVVDLSQRRRLSRLGRRSAVAGGVAMVVLSASGVAAAGVASGRGPLAGPLAPIHQLLTGESKSDKAATQVERFLALAEADLDAGRLEAARAALAKAAAELAKVDGADREDRSARLTALQERLALLLLDDEPGGSERGSRPDSAGDGRQHGQDTSGEHRKGDGTAGSGRSDDAGPGDREGRARDGDANVRGEDRSGDKAQEDSAGTGSGTPDGTTGVIDGSED